MVENKCNAFIGNTLTFLRQICVRVCHDFFFLGAVYIYIYMLLYIYLFSAHTTIET